VISHVTDPALSEILGVMYDLLEKKKAATAPAAAPAAAAAPATAAAPAKALSQVGDNNAHLALTQAIEAEKSQLKGISEEALERLVNQALGNAASRTPDQQNAWEKDAQMRAIEATLANKIYEKVISEGYHRPTYNSSYYRPYYPTYRGSYLPPNLTSEIDRVLRYHDHVDSYENVNKILGHTLDPKLKEVLEKMYDLVHSKKEEPKAAPAAAAAPAKVATPAAKTLLMTQGVPVFVDPFLRKNEMAGVDIQ
jgi:hypothetical protein